MKNIIFSEKEFEDFKTHCLREGFDLCYIRSEIEGSRREIQNYNFAKPAIVRLKKKFLSFQGVPYDVSECQQKQWYQRLPDIMDSFNKINGREDKEDYHKLLAVIPSITKIDKKIELPGMNINGNNKGDLNSLCLANKQGDEDVNGEDESVKVAYIGMIVFAIVFGGLYYLANFVFRY